MAFSFLISWPYLNRYRYSLLWASCSHCSSCPWLSDTFFDGKAVFLLRDQSFASPPRTNHSLLLNYPMMTEATNSLSSFLLTASALRWHGVISVEYFYWSFYLYPGCFQNAPTLLRFLRTMGAINLTFWEKPCLGLPKRMTASSKWCFLLKKFLHTCKICKFLESLL